MFLGKGSLQTCSKFTGEHSCLSAFSIKLETSFIKITIWYGCAPVHLLHIFRTHSLNNTCERLLLDKVHRRRFPVSFDKFSRKTYMQYRV